MPVDLTKYAKSIAKGKEQAGKPLGSSIPDGKHKGQIKSCDLSSNAKTNNPLMRFRVATLGYNEPLFKTHNLDTDDDWERLGKDLGVLQVPFDVNNPNKLNEDKNECVGKWVAFEKKSKPDGKGGFFINIYFNNLIEAPDASDTQAAEALAQSNTGDDDDVPF